MKRKWITLAVSLSLALGLGLSAAAFTGPADDKETELGKIMEKVQKNKGVLTKGVRIVAAYKKQREDVKAAAEEWVKLSADTKPHKEAAKAAKDVPDAEKKWDELCEAWGNEAKKLAEIASKADSDQKDAKAQLSTTNKTCTDCHTVFRIDADDDF